MDNRTSSSKATWKDTFKQYALVIGLLIGATGGNIDRIYEYVVSPADFDRLEARVEVLEEILLAIDEKLAEENNKPHTKIVE